MTVCIVVEDHRDTREGYVEFIGLCGFSVRSADGAQELRSLLAAEVPDVVVMDLQLPGTDGWDLIREVKKDPRTRHVPVLAVSASVREVDRNQAFSAGADAFLGKPCLPNDIVAELNRLLREAAGDPGDV